MTLQLQNKPIGHYIKKDNQLTKAQFYDVSVTAYRILLLATSSKFIGQIMKDPLAPIYITPYDYHDVYGKGSDFSPYYRLLKDVADDISTARLKVRDVEVLGSSGWDGIINWTSEVYYHQEKKALVLTLSHKILPYILDLQKNYTYYNLRNIAKLNSMHSIRLYELMMFWRKKGATPALSVAYMRTWLGVADKTYPEMKDFNKHVIKKSVQEITDKTDISLEVMPQKEGRSTVGYSFSYTPKITQVNGDGQDESYDQGKPQSHFPPPNEADDADAELPF